MGINNFIKFAALKSSAISLDLGPSEQIYNVAIILLFAYLLGSISFSYIIYKKKTGQDIRTVGSKNPGASNLRRFMGTKWYIFNLVLDIGKGVAAILLAQYFTDNILYVALAGVAAILGHSYPIWLKFKGGKSVAVTIGVFIPINIWVVLIFAAVYFTLTFTLKIVSIASLTAALSLVVGTFIIDGRKEVIFLSVFAFLIIVWRHRSNIKRLFRGKELSQKTDSIIKETD